MSVQSDLFVSLLRVFSTAYPISTQKMRSPYRVEPNVIDFAHGLVAGKLDAPLSSVLVSRVLPHGLDSLLEQMVVGADRKVAGLHNVVINTMRSDQKKKRQKH